MFYVPRSEGQPGWWPRSGHDPDAKADWSMVQFETHEFHMLTSATLIEALYECVEDWLRENTKKTNIIDLDPEDSMCHVMSCSRAAFS